MPWNQYLLLLVGGYWFLHFVHLLRFRAQRLSGQRLLIEAVTAGGLAGLAAFATTRLVMATSFGLAFALEWKDLFPQDLSGTIAAGLLLLCLVGIILRRVWPLGESKNRALAVLGTRFEQLLFRSVQEQSLLGIRFAGGGFVIGWALEAPSLSSRETFFRLLPLVLGHDPVDRQNEYYKLYAYGVLTDRPGQEPGEEVTALKKAILDHSTLYRFVDVETASLVDEDSADEIADRLL